MSGIPAGWRYDCKCRLKGVPWYGRESFTGRLYNGRRTTKPLSEGSLRPPAEGLCGAGCKPIAGISGKGAVYGGDSSCAGWQKVRTDG